MLQNGLHNDGWKLLMFTGSGKGQGLIHLANPSFHSKFAPYLIFNIQHFRYGIRRNSFG